MFWLICSKCYFNTIVNDFCIKDRKRMYQVIACSLVLLYQNYPLINKSFLCIIISTLSELPILQECASAVRFRRSTTLRSRSSRVNNRRMSSSWFLTDAWEKVHLCLFFSLSVMVNLRQTNQHLNLRVYLYESCHSNNSNIVDIDIVSGHQKCNDTGPVFHDCG